MRVCMFTQLGSYTKAVTPSKDMVSLDMVSLCSPMRRFDVPKSQIMALLS